MTTASLPPSAAPARRPRRLVAVLTGLAVALLVLGVGWAFLEQRPTEYRAATTLVVLPDNDNAEAASYYDTLGQGQIASTFAQILDLQATAPEPADGSEPASISVDVLPDTSLIQVTATAADAATAEAAADAALEQVQPYFGQLGWPYDVTVVESAEGTADRTGFSSSVLLGALAVVALVAAIASYLAVRALQQARTARPAARAAVPAGSPRRVAERPAVPASGSATEAPTGTDSTAGPIPLGAEGARPVAGTTAPLDGSSVNGATSMNGSHPAADPQPAR